MEFQMQKANLLADNINRFIKFIYIHYENRSSSSIKNADKLYQIKLFIEEYRFQIIADELKRINQYDWNEKYTLYLVDEFYKGISVIDQYVNHHYEDLFLVSARLYTLKSLSLTIKKTGQE
ncbi:hypothetical protein [Bacillus sp. JJ1764]|uniref:hypothetical protein n=1 Tax=Bacillus sp. JJ1764 TaxID=3122964 RepID=UPI002FFF4023